MTSAESQGVLGPTAAISLTTDRILRLLSEGEIEAEGLIPWSSNATLLVNVRDEEFSTLAVYKPQRGERPLWDFRHGTLGLREVAAYLVCEATGWGFVPPTVLCQGPYGFGSVQFFVHAREDAHFFTIRDDATFEPALMRLAAFDVVANNADRKSGHCLVDQEDKLWAIDNALTFHVEPKLRTVIWDYASQPMPEHVLDGLRTLQDGLARGSPLTQALDQLLSVGELNALRQRLNSLLQAGRFPEPGLERSVPWPLI